MVTPEQIIEATAEHFGHTVEELLSRERHQPLAGARQIAIYLCRTLTDLSAPAVGKAFDRDHTTVLYAQHKIRQDIPADIALAHAVRVITGQLRLAEANGERTS